MLNWTKHNTHSIILLLVIGILITFRFVFLDQDLPSQRLTEYNETDQYWYCQPSLSWVGSSTCLYHGNDYPRLMFDLFQNFFTYPCLMLFGNNSWGFKIPVVLL